jgi:murein DD-endopeptidase MepM/ murein hydrolase activator NlpD
MRHHRNEPDIIVDLGDEPPLLADGGNLAIDRRQVSLRWLTGTVLTGMTSAFLMGGALMVALDGRYTFAATPYAALAATPLPDGADPIRAAEARRVAGGALPKGDRLRPLVDLAATRKVLNLPTMVRVGDKDLIRIRPFVRVSAPLALRKTDQVAALPPLASPLKVFADTDILPGRMANATKNPIFYDLKVDGEVAIQSRDFPSDSTLFDPDVTMTAAEVERIVRDQARFLSDGTVKIAALPVPAEADRFEIGAGITGLSNLLDLRMWPENMSFFQKTEQERGGASTGNGLDEKLVPVASLDALRAVLRDNSADEKQIAEIAKAMQRTIDLKQIDSHTRLRLGVAKIDETNKLKPVRISLYVRDNHLVTVALSDEGGWVTAQEPDITEDAGGDEVDQAESDNGVPTLYESLYQTALDNQVPSSAIKDLVNIFSYDVDFNARVKPGDSLEVFYGLEDENNPKSVREILYCSITVGGQLKRFYRYRSPDDGTVDYYDGEGKSAKKFLMRKPMEGGKFTSGFGGRRHPVLGYYRVHTGVDWGAPSGTPILASGNGVVEDVGWKGGYGRFVKITHSNGYGTGYGHMSGFASGIQKGTKVRQGQVIGYVGSTGMSTGPHLHYEVYINSVAVDPMRVRLPRGKELGGNLLAEFRRERENVDGLMRGSASKMAVAAGN